MVRGIERKKIFRDNKDRDDFLAHLGGNTDLILYQFHRVILIPLPPVIQSHFILNHFMKTPFNSSNSHVVAFAL